MLPARSPNESRRSQLHVWYARTDDFGVAILLILLTIMVLAVGAGAAGQFLSVALSGATLLFILHTAEAHRRTFRFAAVVVTIAVLGAAGALILGDAGTSSAAGLVGLMLAGLSPLIIVQRILRADRITFRIVLGALAIYLLLGLAYAYLFPVIGTLTGKPFFVQTATPGSSDFIYFSYVTLTTVGYGDFTAATSLGRMVAVSEALLGQLYLVSAVALLVSNIGRTNPRRGPGPGDSSSEG